MHGSGVHVGQVPVITLTESSSTQELGETLLKDQELPAPTQTSMRTASSAPIINGAL
jgi:hypothetical protein